jgi:cytochrome bd ubiquinol oxidase subunit II
VPALWAVPTASVLALSLAGSAHLGGRGLVASIASGAAIVLLFASAAVGMFPTIVRALSLPSLSLTAYNASSSLLALEVMVVVVAIGLPAVFAYTAWMHWLFRQPVSADAECSE